MSIALTASLGGSHGRAQSMCPYQPTNDVPLDVEAGVPLAFWGKLEVFNLYWAANWDADPRNFRRAEIEATLQGVLGSAYFDHLCQYGVPGFRWGGSTEANPVCGGNPGSMITTPGVFSFAGCEEQYSFLTGVPQAHGLPSPTCAGCPGPGDCFVDPACLSTPNPTGDRVYIVFLPKGTTIDDFGIRSCSNYGAYHFQIPTRMGMSPPFTWFFGTPPFVPGTQGRPLNLAIIPTDCYTSVSDLMSGVTHELVEAATDPLPPVHWIDNSRTNGAGRLDPTHIETLLKAGEIADICGTKTRFTTSNGSQADLADYWSNHDNRCVALPPGGQVATGSRTRTGPTARVGNADVTPTKTAPAICV